MVYHHRDNFGDHRYSYNGDIMLLICLLTSYDPIFKWLCEIMGESSPRQVNTFPNLKCMGFLQVEISCI